MPKIFITSIAAVDYEPLRRKYGGDQEMISMTQGYVDLTTPESVANLYQRVKRYLEQSSPEDFIVLSGAAVISVIVVHFWLKYHGIARVLTYNKRSDSYQEVTLTDTDMIHHDKETQDNS